MTAFLLKMNKAGRKDLLADPEDKTKIWASTLVEQKDNCQAIFYLLSENIGAYLPFLQGSVEKKTDLRVYHNDKSQSSPRKKRKL